MDFKVGDKVVWRNGSAGYRTNTYTVEHVDKFLDRVGVSGLYGLFRQVDFKLAPTEPNLETELRLCESRRDIVVGRVSVLKQEEMSLESRIHELQQAIKERDKPKGRVGLKDSLNRLDAMYGISGDGIIFRAESKRDKQEYRALGNLFYDKESAERAVHDRKQRVLRGEDV